MTQFITPMHIVKPALCPKGLYILLYTAICSSVFTAVLFTMETEVT